MPEGGVHDAINAEIALSDTLDVLTKTSKEMSTLRKLLQKESPEEYSLAGQRFQGMSDPNVMLQQFSLDAPSDKWSARTLMEYLINPTESDSLPKKRYYLGEGTSRDRDMALMKAMKYSKMGGAFAPGDSLSSDLVNRIMKLHTENPDSTILFGQ